MDRNEQPTNSLKGWEKLLKKRQRKVEDVEPKLLSELNFEQAMSDMEKETDDDPSPYTRKQSISLFHR